MCDVHDFFVKPRWKGWVSTPEAAPLPPATGPWVDLTWPLSTDTPRLSEFPAPKFGKVIAMVDGIGANVSTLEMVAHIGTHLDAPLHFVHDGPSFQDIPVSRLTGQGVVWHLEDIAEYGIIEPEHLEQARPRLRPGDFLVLDADWAGRVGDASYLRHPHLSQAATEWLVEQKIGLLGVDWASPDAAAEVRGDDYLFHAHRILLANGILIAENLTNVRNFRGQRVEFIFGAINIVDGDGSPTRVLARTIAAD